MSEVARVSYFENYIDTLKRRMKQKRIDEKRQEKQDNRDRNSATTSINPAISAQNIGNPSQFATCSTFDECFKYNSKCFLFL
jgi:hypothetical protein